MAGSFSFKLFTIRNDKAALKVGTDAVLLGATTTLRPEDKLLLDIGTGTGVIALMVAQRLRAAHAFDGGSRPITATPLAFDGGSRPITATPLAFDGGSPPITSPRDTASEQRIIAIDIDGPSAEEAGENFAESPWASALTAIHTSLADFRPDRKFDCIFSNPPFYDNSLTNPDAREATARHTESLSYREIFAFSAEWLQPDGHLSLILPADQEVAIIRTAASFGLYPFRIIRVRTTARKPVRRIILEFSRTREKASDESLTLQDGSARSAQYAELTREFYL